MLEYALLRGVAGLIGLLPLRVALVLGWILACCGFYLMPSKIARTKARIRQVFGASLAEREVRRIAWISWRNLFFGAIELIRAPRLTRARVAQTVNCDEAFKVIALLKSAGGLVLALPHMGSWEVGGLQTSLLGLPLVYITRRQKNSLVYAYLNRIRERTGQKCVDRDDPGLVRAILREIKAGRVLAILPDIRARTDALHVGFLGGTACVAAGMGLFARQAGVPILPAVVTREGWTRHRWKTYEPIRPDPSLGKHADWQRMTELVMGIFDRAIREQPEQYFWYNKRWILDPLRPGEDGGAERSTHNAQRSTLNEEESPDVGS